MVRLVTVVVLGMLGLALVGCRAEGSVHESSGNVVAPR